MRSTVIHSVRTIPPKVWFSAVAIADSMVVASLSAFGPRLGSIGLIGLVVVGIFALSPVGFAAILCLVSHLMYLGSTESLALRTTKWLVLGGVFYATIIRYLVERRIPTIRLGNFEKALLAFLAWGLVCSLFADNQLGTIFELLRFGALLLVYLIAKETITDARHIRFLLFVLLLAVLSSSTYSVAGLAKAQYVRFSGFFDTPNGFAAFLNLSIPALLAACLSARRLSMRLLFGFGVLLGTSALLLSWSRASWLAFLVFIVAFLVLEKRRKLLIGFACLVLVSLVLFALSSGVYPTVYRVLRLQAGTTGRTALWHYALQAAEQQPIVGHGFKLSKSAVRGESRPSGIGEIMAFKHTDVKFHPHSFYLAILLATGVPGVILMAWVYYHIFKIPLEGRKRAPNKSGRLLNSALLAMLIGSLVTSLFEIGPIFGSGSYANYCWLMLGLSAAVTEKDIQI